MQSLLILIFIGCFVGSAFGVIFYYVFFVCHYGKHIFEFFRDCFDAKFRPARICERYILAIGNLEYVGHCVIVCELVTWLFECEFHNRLGNDDHVVFNEIVNRTAKLDDFFHADITERALNVFAAKFKIDSEKFTVDFKLSLKEFAFVHFPAFKLPSSYLEIVRNSRSDYG